MVRAIQGTSAWDEADHRFTSSGIKHRRAFGCHKWTPMTTRMGEAPRNNILSLFVLIVGRCGELLALLQPTLRQPLSAGMPLCTV